MKMPNYQPCSGFKSPKHQPRRSAWAVASIVAVSLLSNCTTGKDAGVVAELIMRAGMETAEGKEYDRRGSVSAGGVDFARQRDKDTGHYSIVDPRGQRHNCSTKDCQLTAIQVAGEINNASAEGGGGGSGGGE